MGKIITNKLMLSIFIITLIMMVTLSIFIPQITEKNTIDQIVKHSKISVEQIKLTRTYYVREVVGDIKKYAPNIKFDYQGNGVDGKLAFPTSLVHELSDIFTQNTGSRFQLYSNYPFKPKVNRELNDNQKEALAFFENSNEDIWVKRDVVNNEEVLIVAIPDVMNEQACVSCHNSHPDRTWEAGKWKLDDNRGVLEIVTPLTTSLAANNQMKNKIIGIVFLSMLILVIYYAYILLKRENQLINENDILDKKVKEEVQKNLQKEKQLIQQSRSAAMGDMLAAIIHQWKQPLSAISSHISSLEVNVRIGEADQKYILENIKNVRSNIDNMSTTMNDFKNFFKPQDPVDYDLNNNIIKSVNLVSKIYKQQGIDINLDFKDEIFITGYPNELSQVIVNLLNNARDIILEKNCKYKDIDLSTYKDNEYSYIVVSDFAGGIPEDIIDEVFEPYFTTKSENNGTGIGLDMSKTIINKVDGTIEVINKTHSKNNEKVVGAQFIIKLKNS